MHVLSALLIFLAAFPALAQAASPAEAPPLAPVAAMAMPSSPGAPPQTPPVNPSAPPAAAYRSIFFTPPEIKGMDASLAEYKEQQERIRSGTVDLIDALQAPAKLQPITRMVTHAQFYLAAIVYRGSDEWTIWLNNMKFTQETPTISDVTVVSVQPRQAVFEWKPAEAALYASRPIQDTGGRVAMQGDAVRFVLSPNQSFSAYDLSVQEGYLGASRQEQVTTLPPALPQKPKRMETTPLPPGAPDPSLPTAKLPPVPTLGIYHTDKK